MRIGELADLIGLSTRAVRHYHSRGLLPEPTRRANGYREYGLRDAITLARIRRLTELGLSLDEVRTALADDHGHELHEVLVELDSDLARQQAAIQQRRTRLAVLIERAAKGQAHDAVSPGMADLLGALGTEAGGVAELERDLFKLLDTTVPAADRDQIVAVLRSHAADPAALARGDDLRRRLDELADAEVDDPRVEQLASELAETMPAELRGMPVDFEHPFSAEILATLSPAQAEVIRRATR